MEIQQQKSSAQTSGQEALTSSPDTPLTDPFLETSGHLADDPFWDEMMDSIRRHRREMDAEWDTAE